MSMRLTARTLLLACLIALPGHAGTPSPADRRGQAIAWEFLGGAALGTAGAGLGLMAGVAYGECKDGSGWFGSERDCSGKMGAGLLGALIGNAVGNTVGISLAGSAFDQGGSPGVACVAGLVGNLVSIPLAAALSDAGPVPFFAALLLAPAIGGTLGYQTGVRQHLNETPQSETSLRLREGAERLAATPTVAGLLEDGVRADLVTFRF